MVQDLNTVAPVKGVFEDVTQRQKKEDLIDKTLIIHAFAEMTGDDGDYAIILCNEVGDEKQEMFTTTANTIMLERLQEAVKKIGVDDVKSSSKEKYFSEPISATLKQVQGSKRPYYVLE